MTPIRQPGDPRPEFWLTYLPGRIAIWQKPGFTEWWSCPIAASGELVMPEAAMVNYSLMDPLFEEFLEQYAEEAYRLLTGIIHMEQKDALLRLKECLVNAVHLPIGKFYQTSIGHVVAFELDGIPFWLSWSTDNPSEDLVLLTHVPDDESDFKQVNYYGAGRATDQQIQAFLQDQITIRLSTGEFGPDQPGGNPKDFDPPGTCQHYFMHSGVESHRCGRPLPCPEHSV